MRELDRVIRRCLRKDPALRYEDTADLKISLDELKQDSDSGTSMAYEAPPRNPRRRGWAVAAAVVLASAVLLLWLSLRKPVAATGEQLAIVRQLTFDSGLTTIRHTGPGATLLRMLLTARPATISISGSSRLEARQLTQNAADDYQPDFSPDGTNIVFRSERDGGGLYIVPTLGGTERRLMSTGYDPRFSPDGKWICYWVGDISRNFGPGKTFIIPAEGGEPIEIAPKMTGAARAAWSPDGRRIMFTSAARQAAFGSVIDQQTQTRLFVQTMPTGEPVMTDLLKGSLVDYRNRSRVTWAGDELIYSASAGDAVNIWRLPIDSETLRARGPAQRLKAGTSLETNAILAGRKLIYSDIVQNTDIWSVPIDSMTSQSTGNAVRLTRDLAADVGASVSADVERIAWFAIRSQEADLMIQDGQSKKNRS